MNARIKCHFQNKVKSKIRITIPKSIKEYLRFLSRKFTTQMLKILSQNFIKYVNNCKQKQFRMYILDLHRKVETKSRRGRCVKTLLPAIVNPTSITTNIKCCCVIYGNFLKSSDSWCRKTIPEDILEVLVVCCCVEPS